MKKLKRVLIIVCAAALVMSLSACGSSNNVSTKEFEWPTSGLATMLPEPSTLKGEIVTNNDNYFTADISKITESDYEEYMEACKNTGFTIDADTSSSSFGAFNEDGYKVSLNYHSNDEYYRINLNTPMYEDGETFKWPTSVLAQMIPEPVTNVGRISLESSNALCVYVGDSSLDDYNNYIDECIAVGFDVDYSRSEKYYHAKNEVGVTLSVTYEGFNTFYIDITAYGIDLESEEADTDEYSEFDWPNSDIAKLLPVPKSNIGKIGWEASYGFVIYVAKTPKEDYDEYVDEVLNAGFNVDYNKTDAAFYADNEDGYHVYLRFEDDDVMFVRIDEPKEEVEEEVEDEIEDISDSSDSATTDSEDITSENSSSNSVGVSDEFKDAMDTYEEFFDEYVAFMKKYNESSDTTSMLSDLSSYMTKYAEMMEKLDALEDELSPAELKYYLEVMARINKKLAELY